MPNSTISASHTTDVNASGRIAATAARQDLKREQAQACDCRIDENQHLGH